MTQKPPPAPEDKLVVIAYHTTHGPYRKHAKEMKLSAERFGLNVHIEEVSIPESANWHQCVHHKPIFIQEMLWRFDESHVLFVDVDARFKLRPLLFLDNPRFELSYHIHQWSGKHEREHISAVMFFHRDWAQRIEFVASWYKAIRKEDNGNQPALKRAYFLWNETRGPINFLDCGPEYFWIYDRFAKLYPDKEPVIEHLQESRKARNRHLNS